jgi:hypothetical protein
MLTGPALTNAWSCATPADASAGLAGGQVRLPLATGIKVELLIRFPIWSTNGTAHPVGALLGTVNTIWSSPMQQPDRPW